MNIEVFDDYSSLSKRGAFFVARHLLKSPDLVLGLPTGETPKGLYEKLVDLYNKGLLDFSQVATFNLDEYYPVSQDNPVSFKKYMYDRFFNYVNVPERNIHIPDGSTGAVDKECKQYEKAIIDQGGIDLVVLGIGENGHIGYNEPGSDWGSKTRLVDLDDGSVIRSAFGGQEKELNQAITMGVKTIMKSRKVLMLVSGARKAEVIHRTVDGPVTNEVPASILQLHPSVTVYLDREAASEMD